MPFIIVSCLLSPASFLPIGQDTARAWACRCVVLVCNVSTFSRFLLSLWYDISTNSFLCRYCVAGLGLIAVSHPLDLFYSLGRSHTLRIPDCLFLASSSGFKLTSLQQVCGAYYYVWIILLPKIGGYEIVEEVEESVDGARNRKLVRRYHKTTPTADSSEEDPLIVDVRQAQVVTGTRTAPLR